MVVKMVSDEKTAEIKKYPRPSLTEENKVGAGRFGTVYMCNIEGFGSKVFVAKEFIFEDCGGPNKTKQNFEREAKTLNRFNNENIVRLIGVYEHSRGMGLFLEKAECSLGWGSDNL